MTELIPAPVHDGRRLDWFPRFDPASLDYPIAAGPATPLPARGRLWQPGRILDQGREGACVGFGCAAEAAAEPVSVPRVTNAVARSWYRNAQRRDQWPGEAYDGTSVLAGCLEGRARGLYAGFRWAKRAEQLLAGIAADPEQDGGPALLGVQWTEGSYETDQLGVLRPSGDVVGGHCVCVLGVVVPADLTADDAAGVQLRNDLEELELLDGVRAVLEDDGEDAAAIVQNSWGEVFGRNGLCVVPLTVLQGWARAGWEAAQPQGRRLPGRKGVAMSSTEEQPATESTDSTLHITAAEIVDGDRILDPPEELGQESVTVRGTPQLVTDWRGRRIVVNSRAGTFTLGATSPVTVRRRQ